VAVVICIQPEGGVQDAEAGDREAMVGEGEAVSVDVSICKAAVMVAVGVGKFGGNVAGTWVGVAGGGNVSASERKIPPRTRITETIAMMTPPPNWRRDCIINSPSSL
jgi:hypothetical protein